MSKRTHPIILIVLWLFVIACVSPLILVFMVSITNETEIVRSGYSFMPEAFSLKAYEFLFNKSGTIIRAYGVTAFVTVVGTALSLLITALLAYPLSRRDFPLRKLLAFLVFFTIMFNGGLVPGYLVYTTVLHLRDSIWNLILPNLLLNGFNVLLMRTFFQTTIPGSLIESANIDGAGEGRIFTRIILPLSLPVIATVGLFQTLAYWNDWFNALIYVNNEKLYNLQYLLNQILMNIQFLAKNNNSADTAKLLNDMPTETVRMAMAVMGIGPILLAYPFFQKYFVKGLTVGAVKG